MGLRVTWDARRFSADFTGFNARAHRLAAPILALVRSVRLSLER